MRDTPDDRANDGWEELDQLVCAELNALRSGSETRPARPVPPQAGHEPQQSNVIFKPNWGSVPPTPAPEGASGELCADETPALDAAALLPPAPDGNVVDLDVFNEDERRFIQHAVEWLKPRSNKDVVLARIWECLTEAEDAAFFTTAPEEDEAMPPAVDQPAPDEPEED